MFSWIDRIWNWATHNIGGAVVDFIRDALHGLWGFLSSIFGNVTSAWDNMWEAGERIVHELVSFLESLYRKLAHLIRVYLPCLVKYFLRLWHDLSGFVNLIWHYLLRRIEFILHLIEASVKWLLHWVIVHIWRPLLHDILTAWHWITHFGDRLWYYLTHPDKAVDLIWQALLSKLEREAWNIGHLLGKFFLSLVIHNVRRFILLVEDIVMALF